MSARRIALVLAGIGALGLASLLLLEVCVRIFSPRVLEREVPDLWMPDAAIGWRHRPDVHVVANTGERDVDVCTNSAGDRVACGVPPSTGCKQRILAIGDAYAEALGVPYEETVWSRIDADTGACTDDAGVAAYYLGQDIALTRERLARPDTHYALVIVAFYLGRLTQDPDKLPPPQEVQSKPVRLFPAGLSEKAIWEWFYPWNSWLESHSQAYVAGRTAIRRALDPGHVGVWGVPAAVLRSRFTPALREGTVRGLRELAQDAHRRGARVLVSLIPHQCQVDDPDGATLVSGVPELAGDVDMDLASRELVPQLQAVPEIDRVVDLLPALRARRNEPLSSERDPHLSPVGHAVWFEAIRAPVRELLAAGPPPPER